MTTKTVKHTPGQMDVQGQTCWILHDTIACNRITVSVQEGFISHHKRISAAEARATTAHLALCWNMHDELMAALRAMVDAMRRDIFDGVQDPSAQAKAEIILAKATGETT